MRVALKIALIGALLIIFGLIGCAPHQQNITNGNLVFQSYRDGNYDLYIMNLDGSEQRNLTNIQASDGNPTSNISPVPSPDGRRIAFETNRDGNLEIYVLDIQSGLQVNVTSNEFDDYSPTWSPDGE